MIISHGVRNTKNGSYEAYFVDQDQIEIVDGPYETEAQAIQEHDLGVDLLFGDSELYYSRCEDVPLTPERTEGWQ